MMERLVALMAEHGLANVEMVAWWWASDMEDAELRRTVELALAWDGVHGLRDLVLAGSALGGLELGQLDEFAAFAAAELSAPVAA